MIFLKAFIFAGLVCGIAQIILDNTKFTPGHITSLLTVIGAFLSFVGCYDKFIGFAGAGATILISNFGHILYTSGLAGYEEAGFLGLFTKLLCSSGVAIVGVVIFSFVFTLLFKAKD